MLSDGPMASSWATSRLYTTVDVTAAYPLSAAVKVAADISNVFNDRHWEAFGGSVLKRRALLSLQFDW